MGNYPPPPYPPPAGPPYGGDWKYQRRILREQARAQRDMLRAQREVYRYQTRSMRRSSILGPLVLITVTAFSMNPMACGYVEIPSA